MRKFENSGSHVDCFANVSLKVGNSVNSRSVVERKATLSLNLNASFVKPVPVSGKTHNCDPPFFPCGLAKVNNTKSIDDQLDRYAGNRANS